MAPSSVSNDTGEWYAVRQYDSPEVRELRCNLDACLVKITELEKRVTAEAEAAKQHVDAEFQTLLADVEVATKHLAEEVNVAPSDEIQEASSPPQQVQQSLSQEQGKRLTELVSQVVLRTKRARKVLEKVFCCPISLDIVRVPVLAPDGRIYERGHIMEWLRREGTSPVARTPMRPSELLSDRVVEQATAALWMLRGEEPPKDEDEVTQGDWALRQQGGSSQAHVHQLLEAIRARDEAAALQILRMVPLGVGLNERFDEDKKNLLHLALLNGLSSVAVDIVAHPAFTGHQALMLARGRRIIAPIHIAAAMGLLSVCEALLRRKGGGILVLAVPHDATLLCYDGTPLQFGQDHTPMQLAELQGHAEVAAALRTALVAFAYSD